mmetsp:Transcript_15640/g.61111  ORF Transcript_15640/g.61111 Transcript_15640/m.61111 type:complete len:303 (-) Transcript_15640:1775-2683(-)
MPAPADDHCEKRRHMAELLQGGGHPAAGVLLRPGAQHEHLPDGNTEAVDIAAPRVPPLQRGVAQLGRRIERVVLGHAAELVVGFVVLVEHLLVGEVARQAEVAQHGPAALDEDVRGGDVAVRVALVVHVVHRVTHLHAEGNHRLQPRLVRLLPAQLREVVERRPTFAVLHHNVKLVRQHRADANQLHDVGVVTQLPKNAGLVEEGFVDLGPLLLDLGLAPLHGHVGAEVLAVAHLPEHALRVLQLVVHLQQVERHEFVLDVVRLKCRTDVHLRIQDDENERYQAQRIGLGNALHHAGPPKED